MMTSAEYAASRFEAIVSDIPANACLITEKDKLRRLDIGEACAGGWTSVKLMLDALIAGKGLVTIARDFRGIHQFPAVEMLYDDPVGAASFFVPDERGIIGVKDGGMYAFGVTEDSDENTFGLQGNLVVTGRASLASACLDSAKALPEAVALLLGAGIAGEAIQWAWSFAPIADLSLDADVLGAAKLKARERRVVSIWLREADDARLRSLAAAFTPGTLRLHNLTTAHTILPDGPDKVINANH